MKKDKITIAYMLITITLIVLASVYFFKVDLRENNDNIGKGAAKAFTSGKVYSEKMYTMLNGYASDFMADDNETKAKKEKIVSQKKANKTKKLKQKKLLINPILSTKVIPKVNIRKKKISKLVITTNDNNKTKETL